MILGKQCQVIKLEFTREKPLSEGSQMLRAVWWVLGSALPCPGLSVHLDVTYSFGIFSISCGVSLAKESLEVEVPGSCTSWKKFMRMGVDGEACHLFMLR